VKFTSYDSQDISRRAASSPIFSWAYNIMSIHAFGRSKGIANLGLALWPLADPIDAIRRRAIVATAT
jgi:hypothetical protein